MRVLRLLMVVAVLAVAACATVRTDVVRLKPSEVYPPTQSVEVLLEKPKRPYVEIALLESSGEIGISEAQLLNDAREKARSIGADAIVRLEAERVYQPPMAVYEPYDPFYWSYPYRPYLPYGHPWGSYRVVGGGYTYVVKSLAIKYRETQG